MRCARFNQKKPLVVTFGGAYHGWWDGMQPAAGNERTPTDVLCLKDMNSLSLAVIRSDFADRRTRQLLLYMLAFLMSVMVATIFEIYKRQHSLVVLVAQL